jgi:CRP-like cAMP-binding protein
MDALIKKLSHFFDLTGSEQIYLERFGRPEEAVAAKTDLIRIDDPITDAVVLLEGWALRYRYLPDGRRQILTFAVPGDVVGLEGSLLRSADYTFSTITECRVAYFAHTDWPELLIDQPRLAAAILWVSFTEQAMFLERLVSLGRRTARERVGHLLCELLARLSMIDGTHGSCFRLPVTQDVLADTLGLSTVHVYRCLQALRSDDLVRMADSSVELLDRDSLAKEAAFEPAYFHLAPAPWWTQQALLKFEGKAPLRD